MDKNQSSLEDYILLLKKKIKKSNKVDLDQVARATEFGKRAHSGSYRMSGEIYYVHPVRVAIMAADYVLDTKTIVASLLHDVIEDTAISSNEIKEQFGATVAELVEALTKVRESKQLTLYKIFSLGNIDFRVLLIKLLDRLDNLSDLDALARKKQRVIINETITIYTEVAQGLGLIEIEEQMRDLSFKHLYPNSYRRIAVRLNRFYDERHVAINQIMQTIREIVDAELIISISPHYVKPHEFMFNRGEIEKILNYIQIETRELINCYKIMGQIHIGFRSVPLKIRDYISNPKANGWRGLSTKVLVEGEQININIVTEDFHENNRKGVITLINEGVYHSENYMQFIQLYLDVASDNVRIQDVFRLNRTKSIQILTPAGDVIELRYGSTILDFAFMIHSEIGLHCVGGVIDNIRYPRNKILEEGMIVRVLTSDSILAELNWLEDVIMPKSRKEILKQTQRQVH